MEATAATGPIEPQLTDEEIELEPLTESRQGEAAPTTSGAAELEGGDAGRDHPGLPDWDGSRPAGLTLIERVSLQEEEAGDAEESFATLIKPGVSLLRKPSVEPGETTEFPPVDSFIPHRPTSFEAAGLIDEDVEKLIYRYLYLRGAATGHALCEQVGLPYALMEPLLRTLKHQMVLAYKQAAAAGDYQYILTDVGLERGRREAAICAYAESAPVPMKDYVASVEAQSLVDQRVHIGDLRRAFSELLIEQRMLDRLGPAINSGRGLFLYGSPGNGKTSIAERVTSCFGSHIWIPRAIGVDGDIIRLFDPVIHEEAEDSDAGDGETVTDQRWVRIKRPTVVVGGELTMDQLELKHNAETNVSEAPLQMKSNCGALVIDDFGRQRMPTSELLNRWIVPLEARYDFQNLSSGKKLQVPFDQLVIFSTNLEPEGLVDEAFLRRIPYKIEISDPTPESFRKICEMVAPALGFNFDSSSVDYLIQRHYVEAKRPMRSCHPRDLLLQVRSYCLFHKLPLELTPETIDIAVENYFTVM